MYHMTIEELKDEIYKAIKQVNANDEPIFIGEEDKEPEAVLVSLEEFEDMLEAIRIFSDKELSDIIFGRVEGDILSWVDALKELGFSDDTLDETLENSDIESAIEDRVKKFDSAEDLNDEEKRYRN